MASLFVKSYGVGTASLQGTIDHMSLGRGFMVYTHKAMCIMISTF